MFLECKAGKFTINLQLHLGFHHSPPQPTPHHSERRVGPSRLCRRARRTQARDKAAEKGAASPTPEPDQTGASTPDQTNRAVKASASKTSTAEVAVQVDLHVPTTIPAKANHASLPVPEPAEQYPAKDDPPRHDLQDMFCPDSQYLTCQLLDMREMERKRREEREKEIQAPIFRSSTDLSI